MSKNYRQLALDLHSQKPTGKIGTVITKPLNNQEDLSLAYSPWVAEPCKEIEKDPNKSWLYTNRSNLVAVITDGTAVLGLGNIGATASKPVMEGKSALFKKFANINSFDLCLNTKSSEEFINIVQSMEPSFGGINLEDIKAPECFEIEEKLIEKMDIPVFHDDQHGTAIVFTAGLINACKITNRNLEDIKMVVNGAGAAAISCIKMAISVGVKPKNIIACDSQGTIYKGRTQNMNKFKERIATETDKRTLEETIKNADVFCGLSVKGALTKEMVKTMKDEPIIFAMANPDPEILPKDVFEVAPDAIVATGRSDFANQVNNVLCFPYIFRGALDVHAKVINQEMKIKTAKALAELARQPVPQNIKDIYNKQNLKFGKEYIIPAPFDNRIVSIVAPKVAQVAMETNVARKKIDIEQYKKELTE